MQVDASGPNPEPTLTDTEIDAYLDQVDATYQALSPAKREDLQRSVQQAEALKTN